MSEAKKQGGGGSRNWYVIYANTGYENAVVKNLKQRIVSLGMEDYIFDAVVPTQKTKKIKSGKEVEEEERIYPGYILIDMIVTDESWWVVRNTPRVSGFLGTGIHPVPITDKEMLDVVEKTTGDAKSHSMDTALGDFVKIKEGPFKDTEGKVIEKDEVTGLLKVSISMFGRDTEVELSHSQIKAI